MQSSPVLADENTAAVGCPATCSTPAPLQLPGRCDFHSTRFSGSASPEASTATTVQSRLTLLAAVQEEKSAA